MPAPKVAEVEAFAPDIKERHPQEIRGFDWLLLVGRASGGESDKMDSGKLRGLLLIGLPARAWAGEQAQLLRRNAAVGLDAKRQSRWHPCPWNNLR